MRGNSLSQMILDSGPPAPVLACDIMKIWIQIRRQEQWNAMKMAKFSSIGETPAGPRFPDT